MGWFSRFFGRKATKRAAVETLSLQLLFERPFEFDEDQLRDAIQSYHPSMRKAKVNLVSGTLEQQTPFGHLQWGRHAIQIVGFNQPMPEHVVEWCVNPAPYRDSEKDAARAHLAHMLLWYQGDETDPLEQYLSLALAAGALAPLGAVFVLNESARTSLPIQVINARDPLHSHDIVEFLREMPLLLLYCGMVKYDVEERPGVLMRTYGNRLLGLPDLAHWTTGHDQASAIMELFDNVMQYMRDSGAILDVGHTMQIEEETYLKIRSPRPGEFYEESEPELLVLDTISAREINR